MFENFSILNIAKKIQERTGAKLIINKSVDIRSYKQDSSRLIKTGFKPKYNVDVAIDELLQYFSKNKPNNFGDKNFNLKMMKKLNVQ